jgi:aconitate hydratase
LGVKVVVAQSFERIHRSNLVGMGVLPLQFKDGTNAQSLQLDGTETYDVLGLSSVSSRSKTSPSKSLAPTDRSAQFRSVANRHPIEIDYYKHGGILSYVLRQLVAQ